jgi:hypothetical protein
VYESTPLDWLQYACGIGEHLALGDGSDVCGLVGEIDPNDLNYPSIAVGDLRPDVLLHRRLTVPDQADPAPPPAATAGAVLRRPALIGAAR